MSHRIPRFSDGVCVFNPQQLGTVWKDMEVSLDESSAFSSEGQQGSLFDRHVAPVPPDMKPPMARDLSLFLCVKACLCGLFLVIVRQLVNLYSVKLMWWTIPTV